MWHAHDGGGWGLGWVWMIVVMAVVWVPLLIAFLWFMRSLAGDRARTSGDGGAPRSEAAPDDAREIARRAYARGDLDRERFLQIMEDLGGGAGGPKPGS
jgi:uncharacterized membrane protein